MSVLTETICVEKGEVEINFTRLKRLSRVEDDLNEQQFKQTLPVYQEEVAQDWPQILALLVGSIITLTAGLIYSWTSPFILVLANDKHKYDIEEHEGTIMSIFQSSGLLIASPFCYLLVNRIGRKRTVLLAVIPQALSWILSIVGTNVWWFYVSRVCGGLGDALTFGALPLWAGEVATPKIRGSWGNLLSVSYYAGMFLINVIGSYCNIQQTAYISLGLLLVFVISFAMMPESPYYFIMKGKDEEARESLSWLLRKRNVDTELNAIKSSVESEMKDSAKWKELFVEPSNRKSLSLGVFLRFAQQLSGISVFECYTQLIFVKSGSDFSSAASAMIFSFLLWILSFGFSFVLDKLGRRSAFVYSCIGSSIALFVQALFFYFDEVGATFTKNLNWFPLTVLSMYLVSYCSGLAIIPTLILSELFPSNIKSKGVAVLSMTMGLANLVGLSIFHFINLYLQISVPFFIFAFATMFSAIFGFYYVPDLQGKTLAEIQREFKKE